MINNKGVTAVICCDTCQKQLSEGPYPADAQDNVPSDCLIISGDGDVNDKHYCAVCKGVMEEEEILHMDVVLGRCRQLIEAKNVAAAVRHFSSKMNCTTEEAIETVGFEFVFYKSVNELQD